MAGYVSFSPFLVGLYVLFLSYSVSYARIHRLKIEGDDRRTIDLTTFGFLKGGYLSINITAFSFAKNTDQHLDDTFGFTLDKTVSTGISPYLESRSEDCILRDANFDKDQSVSIIFFKMDFKSNPPALVVKRVGDDLKNLAISLLSDQEISAKYDNRRVRRSLDFLRDSYLLTSRGQRILARRRRDAGNITTEAGTAENKEPTTQEQMKPETPTEIKTTKQEEKNSETTKQTEGKATKTEGQADTSDNETTDKKEKINQVAATTEKDKDEWKLAGVRIPMKHDAVKGIYKVHFAVKIDQDDEEGLYNLFFHNCAGYGKKGEHATVNLTVHLTERNAENYLSAGQMPLPSLYFVLALVNFVLGCVWFYILKKSDDGVYKLHYLMLTLLYVKSIALLFHGLNFHFIRIEGHHEEAFAVLYYITYLMKGTLLFVTILLIGAGWAFVKHILSDREKKIFIIVIPLQILANVAQIIIEETEEGQSQYTTWKEIFILVDLLCCGAILFPVVWSIRHLQEASQTDGKAAINLQKLKIFRHFYIMIVCYIYFTRIIVYLINITVPFQYEWLDELFKELASLVFFVVTGHKFRPASNNPYLQVPQSDDEEDLEMDMVIEGKSGAMEGLTRVNQAKDVGPAAVEILGGASGSTKPKQRESSHEYD